LKKFAQIRLVVFEINAKPLNSDTSQIRKTKLILYIFYRGRYFRTTFRNSAPRTGAEPQFRRGIAGAELAEKKRFGMGGAEPPKITSTPPHRQKIISI